MRTEKEETMKMDELINSIELRSPSPGKDHSAEKSFSRLMTRIQTDNNSIDIFRPTHPSIPGMARCCDSSPVDCNERMAIHDAGFRSFVHYKK